MERDPQAAPPSPPTYISLKTGADWPAYGGTHEATRYSPLDQITPDNVGQLEKIWEFRTGDLPRGRRALRQPEHARSRSATASTSARR